MGSNSSKGNIWVYIAAFVVIDLMAVLYFFYDYKSDAEDKAPKKAASRVAAPKAPSRLRARTRAVPARPGTPAKVTPRKPAPRKPLQGKVVPRKAP